MSNPGMDKQTQRLLALTGASAELASFFNMMGQDILAAMQIVRQYRVLEVYPNGRLRCEPSDHDPNGPSEDIDLYRMTHAVVAPGDYVLAMQFSVGAPIVIGTVATADSDTAIVRARWDQLIDPPAVYAPDIIPFRYVQPAGQQSTTNTATMATIGANQSQAFPAGTWGCILTASAVMANTGGANDMAFRLAVGGQSVDQIVTGTTQLPSTSPTAMRVTMVRNVDLGNPIIYGAPSTFSPIAMGFRGSAGTTYVRGAEISGFFYRISQ